MEALERIDTRYVKLSREVDADAHKRPVEAKWQERDYTVKDAEQWVMNGYGVGLAVHRSKGIAVLDLDEDTEEARRFVDAVGAAGALVCKTLRGYHVFVKGKSDWKDSKSAVVRFEDLAAKAELYAGSSARSIVLPVAGTPRAALGGKVLWARGQKIDNPVRLGALNVKLSDLKEIDIEIGGNYKKNEQQFVENDQQAAKDVDMESGWAALFGAGWLRCRKSLC